ncbi:MAG: ribonuclease Y [Clostridia bacterium]|nr:ribonuclease Y [Clostridia bacterium]
MEIAMLFIGLAVGLLLGIGAGVMLRKIVAERKVGSAVKQANQILEEAIKNAETRKKESLIEAKEEILAAKNEADEELKERRKEVSRMERRIQQKEEVLDRKTEGIDKKEQQLQQKLKDADEELDKIKDMKADQLSQLERVAQMTKEEAKAEIVVRLDSEIAHETAMKLASYEERFREDAEGKAREILAQVIQRCAADQVSEATISVVALPGEEMKGRVIGREGRNIRTIETLTGVELIVDDTPEVITISGFDPVRREVARLALEKLISDGRIHPARIEEMVEKAQKDVEASIKTAGEKAVFETGVHGLPTELIKLLGRMKYRTSYGQNVLRHSIEVSLLSGMLADELGADATVAKRAGLLHDIGKAMTAEVEGSHVQIGADIARKYRESKEIVHAIEAHHGDVEATSVIDLIVQAADAISAARPGARRENMENYIKRLQKLEEIASDFAGVEKTFAIQAGREVRVIVTPEEVSEDRMMILAHDIAKKIENEMTYPGQIKVHVIRESRAVEYAR